MLLLFSKGIQLKVKAELRDVWLAESRDADNKALDILLVRVLVKYPTTAMKKLWKD
ncbi:MAG: hypothetical protein ACTS73_03080 [Arsenophonus sp. NEOnobi-MAG3]